ncbi:hypothetical protein LCGC14_1399740 [marine sediment metagenome]|uniref:Glycosyl transferase family 1 domain-containing protein n=1 Tax=marine sediment metagenome TaxID=412755 RepID=A0A0F9JXG0_9ZZZZ
MRITKLYAPWSLQFFSPRMKKRYGFDGYYDPYSKNDRRIPIVVFGCYGRGTKADIMNHPGLVVIVWSGSDSTRLHEMGSFVKFCKANTHRIFHIAHSHWIQTALDHFGLTYIDRVVLPADFSRFSFEEECGNSVYHYGTHQRMWYYGTAIMKKLEKKWGGSQHYPKIHKTVQNAYSQDELYNLYKDSFMGVRLTEHDNMALSCIEMGLMGRRSIFNGNIPCAIPYPCHPYDRYEPETRRRWVWQDESILGVVEKMILEYMGTKPDKLLAEEMAEFVHDDEDWLDTKFYE